MQRDALAKPVDLIIGTPQKVAQHAEAGNLFYGDVQVLLPLLLLQRPLLIGQDECLQRWLACKQQHMTY